MFRGLIASLPRGDLGGGFARGSSVSIVLHAGLVVAAVFATRHDGAPDHRRPRYVDTIWFVNPEPLPPSPQAPYWPGGLPAFPSPGVVPVNIPPIEGVNPAPDMPPLAGMARDTTARVLGIFSAGNPGQLYLESVVDEKPERISSPPLEYPDLLRQAGIEGAVTFEVVIDSAGHAEPGSLRVVGATNKAFEASARKAVLGSLFRPGRVGGRLVRVLVQIPVSFTIRRD